MEEGGVRAGMCKATTRKGTGCSNRARPGSEICGTHARTTGYGSSATIKRAPAARVRPSKGPSSVRSASTYTIERRRDAEGFFVFCLAVSGRNGYPWLPLEIKGMIYRYVVGPACNHFDRCATLIGMVCCECAQSEWTCGLCRASMRRCGKPVEPWTRRI
jgi:hypothetical protein